MIDKFHIEKILKVNGLDPDAPDDEIKGVLVRARWHEDDIVTALITLRSKTSKEVNVADAVHQVFYSDDKIHPETLSAILGMDVEVQNVSTEHRKKLRYAYRKQIFSILVLSTLGALTFILASMWYLQFGIFYG